MMETTDLWNGSHFAHRAGNSYVMPNGHPTVTVHPRACGELDDKLAEWYYGNGSSPVLKSLGERLNIGSFLMMAEDPGLSTSSWHTNRTGSQRRRIPRVV